MAKNYLDGTGILPDVLDFDAINRRIEEREAEERALEQAAAEHKAEQEALLDQLEAALTPGVHDELMEEIADRELSPRTLKRYREDFLRYKAHCQHWDPPLPYLPGRPQAVAAFLTSEISHGKAHVRRLAKAITRAHSIADLPSPCDDLLVRATIRLANEQPTTDKPPSQHKGLN
jgi:hypothetical protein